LRGKNADPPNREFIIRPPLDPGHPDHCSPAGTFSFNQSGYIPGTISDQGKCFLGNTGQYQLSLFSIREETAAGRATRQRMSQIRARLGDPEVILLGVDRLDYTKGIDLRLRAVDELLGSGRHSVNDLALVQVSVPSRESVDEYVEVRSRVEKLVGQINGEHGEVGQVPVHYLRRNLPIARGAVRRAAAEPSPDIQRWLGILIHREIKIIT